MQSNRLDSRRDHGEWESPPISATVPERKKKIASLSMQIPGRVETATPAELQQLLLKSDNPLTGQEEKNEPDDKNVALQIGPT